MKRVFRWNLLFLMITCTGFFCQAEQPEKMKVSLYTIDGRKWNGEMVLPYVNSELVEVYNKKNKRIFRSSDIEKVYIWNGHNKKDSTLRLVFLPSYEYKSIKSDYSELNEEPKWMIRLAELDNISLYMVAQRYNGSYTYGRPVDQVMYGLPANHWLYVVREGEYYPTRITLTPDSGYGSNQHFREIGQKYFEDCPGLCNLIREGSITNQYIIDALVYYNDWKNNN